MVSKGHPFFYSFFRYRYPCTMQAPAGKRVDKLFTPFIFHVHRGFPEPDRLTPRSTGLSSGYLPAFFPGHAAQARLPDNLLVNGERRTQIFIEAAYTIVSPPDTKPR